jgi:hypothetical protein
MLVSGFDTSNVRMLTTTSCIHPVDVPSRFQTHIHPFDGIMCRHPQATSTHSTHSPHQQSAVRN